MPVVAANDPAAVEARPRLGGALCVVSSRWTKQVNLQHAASAAQFAALKAAELEVALVRDRPSDLSLDSVLAVEEAMGVNLTKAPSDEIGEPTGVPLHRLAGMTWVKFARSDAPAWHDQVLATLRTHGIADAGLAAGEDERPVPPEVKLAAAGTRRAFAFASLGLARPLPKSLTWHPLMGNPIVRRTWAVWSADSRRREIATLIAALEFSP